MSTFDIGSSVWKQRAHLDNMRAFQWRKLATKRKELLMRWNDERVKEGEPCPFCKTCPQFDYAKGSHVKLIMIDVHADDCELEKELADD